MKYRDCNRMNGWIKMSSGSGIKLRLDSIIL